MSELCLRIADGSIVVVPASLSSITTYVLLEQEAWFEKEVPFLEHVLRPGMTAIDVGANLGVYSLPMARLVGPSGRIFAYEPGSAARALLDRSREMNGCDNLEIIAAALSDGPREGRLSHAASSELNSLCADGPGERVQVTSLDLEDVRCGWSPPDFVKLDAEGEETNILRGGQAFFRRHSPLVMFEIRAGTSVNESLRAAFPAMGYRVYRLLPGAPILVPDDPARPLDAYELNLFAAKPDRAAALAGRGLLVEEVRTWQPDGEAGAEALALWSAQPFARPFAARARATPDPEYRDALAAYARWRSLAESPAVRFAALEFACARLISLYAKSPTFARLSTLARAAGEAGLRAQSVHAMKILVDGAIREKAHFNEPFWPACARYDAMVPDAEIDACMVAAAVEQLERSASHSSIFGGCTAPLDWLCARPSAPAEMERRRVLDAARSGRCVVVPPRLLASAPDHRNAEVWRAGLVPNTRVAT